MRLNIFSWLQKKEDMVHITMKLLYKRKDSLYYLLQTHDTEKIYHLPVQLVIAEKKKKQNYFGFLFIRYLDLSVKYQDMILHSTL